MLDDVVEVYDVVVMIVLDVDVAMVVKVVVGIPEDVVLVLVLLPALAELFWIN